MIDFEDCSIHSLCHPARYYAQNLASRLEDAMMEVADEQAMEADELIRDGKYDEAAEVVGSMIARLEELESSVEGDDEGAYKLTYEEVDNKSYHGRIVRAAEEHGEAECTLGALKAAKKDLEDSPL